MIPTTPVHVHSFLMKRKKRGGPLIPIEDWESSLRELDDIEGALELTIGQIPLITQAEWDDIDWLWPLIINTLEDLASHGSASMYLPGQSTELAVKRARPGTLSVAVQSSCGRRPPRRAAGVEEQNFYTYMLDEGENFFLRLDELDADGWFAGELARLKALRSAVLG